MTQVELVYCRTCPHADAARELLGSVLREVGIPEQWHEWDRESAEAPDYARRYGSPTILVNGNDVVGDPPQSPASSCRVYHDTTGRLSGVPAREAVRAALLASGSS